MFDFKVGYKTFKVDIEIDELIEKATSHMDYDYDGHMSIDTEKETTEEEYKDDIQALINYLKTLKTVPSLLEQIIVEKIAKKKDGWFAKGRIAILFRCDKTAYISEEEYGYRCYCLRAKSTGPDTVVVSLMEDIFKW